MKHGFSNRLCGDSHLGPSSVASSRGFLVANLNHPLTMLAVGRLSRCRTRRSSFVDACSILATRLASVLIARQARMTILDVALLTLSVTGTLIACSRASHGIVDRVVHDCVAGRPERPPCADRMLPWPVVPTEALLRPFRALSRVAREWRGLIVAALTGCIGPPSRSRWSAVRGCVSGLAICKASVGNRIRLTGLFGDWRQTVYLNGRSVGRFVDAVTRGTSHRIRVWSRGEFGFLFWLWRRRFRPTWISSMRC